MSTRGSTVQSMRMRTQMRRLLHRCLPDTGWRAGMLQHMSRPQAN